MGIEEAAAKLWKKIEKLNWELKSGLALSKKQRDKKDNLKDQLKNLQKKLTELKVTKINVKLHLI